MPSDIRSFFGGKPAAPAETAKPKETKEPPKKRGRARKVVEDDEDDEEPTPKKATPKRAAAKKQPEPEPVAEETTASDYFGKGNKPKRSEPVRPKARGKAATEEESKPAKSTPKKATPNGRASTRNKTTTSYVDLDADDFPDDDMEEDADDVFKAGAKRGRRMGDTYEEGTDDEDDEPVKPKRTEKSGKQMPLRGHDQDDADEDVDMKDTNDDDDFVVPDDDEEIVEDKPAKKTTAAAAKKRKAPVVDDDDDEDDLDIEESKPVKKRATPAKKAAPKATPAKKQKKDEPQTNNASMQAIFDSIPTIDAPPPPGKSGDDDGKKKFQYGQHKNAEAPAGAIDPSDFPSGEENCLAGLSFVFTGQLSTIGRDQGSALVKQYGGKVMSAPSKKTSYVVLGDDAGPKKLETIQLHNLKVINEQGLFELIKRLPANGGDSTAAEEQAKKRKKEEDNIRKAAEEMEQQERAKLVAAKPKPQANGSSSQPSGKAPAAADPSNQLWTVRYAPQSINQICGNKAQVEKLGRWLKAFPKNQRTKFKMPGPDGSGTFRAVMIHGPPGIGKTTAAHLVAKLEGYDIVESNASDTRSKKLIENSLKGVLSTTSLMGYFSAGADPVEANKKKLVLIMDEVDGLSAGDRGGVGAIAAVAKKSQIPMILICNERKQPKMKPFDFVTYDLGFRRPTTDMIRGRISTIAFREKLNMPPNVMNALIEGTGADIRQVINMISTAKLDTAKMSFEEGKDMSKAWEKHIVLKPWDMVGKILNGAMFNAASRSSLNDKQELYFNDHDFAPLMLQENYLGTNPVRSGKYNAEPNKKKLANLDLISKAADSISDGDMVDRMIHGSQQQWSLMPTHAMFSFVRPASFVYGSMAGHQTRFTSWMGKNSTQGKLMRMIKEIQGHMRLRTSGDRYEIRQTYLPLLFDRLIKRLQVEGKEAVPEIIELMDEYFLTKDDWDAILELGVGHADMEKVKIETQAKATFTRMYNAASHPLPYMKASQVVAPQKASKEKPDLEEALDESEDEAPPDDAAVKAEEDAEADLTKDKYVKAPKKKRAPAAAKGKGKGKKAAAADDDDDDEEDVKPAKGKGKAAAKGKAKK